MCVKFWKGHETMYYTNLKGPNLPYKTAVAYLRKQEAFVKNE